MKKIILIFTFLFCCKINSQTNIPLNDRLENNSKDSCFVPFYNYSPGAKFFFSKENKPEMDRRLITEYRILKVNESSYDDVYYKYLSGKEFTIDSILDAKDNKKGYILLKDSIGNLLRYEFYLKLNELKKQGDKGISLIRLPYAISMDEISFFSNQYLNSVFYTKFKNNGIKYQKVLITKVSPGTQYAPIRVSFIYENGDVGEKDVCICGNNLPKLIKSNCLFTNYFEKVNPRSENMDEMKWQRIINEEIAIGMNMKEVILAIGQPSKTSVLKTKELLVEISNNINDNVIVVHKSESTNSKERNLITMFYKKSTIILEDDKVILYQGYVE